jgi:uncharacterized protein
MKVNSNTLSTSAIIKIAAGIAVLVIIGSIIFSNHKSGYEQIVWDWREQKDNYFLTDTTSPIIGKEKFSGLNYFIPDPEYKVKANITLLHDSIPIIINRTDGQNEKYIKYAIASFTLQKKEYQLTLLKSIKNSDNRNVLFLPFKDKTNGDDTYEGGRYLDLELKDKGKIIIDFNYAYNPYCVYNPRFSCPIPPQENFMEIEIKAGEKKYQKNK